MTKVLITGGAGFIGSRLAARLVGEGAEVTVLDSLHPQVHAGGWPELAAGVTALPFDVTTTAPWDALFKSLQPDVVVHLAAETGTGQSLTQSSRHGRVNVVGTTELLDGLSRAGHVPSRFVLASSRAVYGEGDWATADGTTFHAAPRGVAQLEAARWNPSAPGDPDAVVHALPHRAAVVEPRPSNIYAATKLAQEHILAAWADAHGADLAVLRLQNVYGPGQSLTNPYTGIVSLFGRLARRHESIPVYEDGDIIRDFVFVDDVVDALTRATSASFSGTLRADIGSGQAMPLLALAQEIARQAGAPEPEINGKYRLGDVRAAFADVTDAHDLLGYTPQVLPAEGTARLLAWIGEQGIE
jgi:dTDP-L-rhamnose 4-epimerase